MGCEICGRGSCTKSFHSLEEQSNFDDVADNIKDRLKAILKRKIERLKSYSLNEEDGMVVVNIEEVFSAIDDCD